MPRDCTNLYPIGYFNSEIFNKSVNLPLPVLLCKDLKGFIYHKIMVQFNLVLVVFLSDNLALLRAPGVQRILRFSDEKKLVSTKTLPRVIWEIWFQQALWPTLFGSLDFTAKENNLFSTIAFYVQCLKSNSWPNNKLVYPLCPKMHTKDGKESE